MLIVKLVVQIYVINVKLVVKLSNVKLIISYVMYPYVSIGKLVVLLVLIS